MELEAEVLRLEKKVDERTEALHGSRSEAKAKSRYLRRNLQALRLQYSGALTLEQQEAHNVLLKAAQRKKQELEVEVQKANQQRIAAEDRLATIELQQSSLQVTDSFFLLMRSVFFQELSRSLFSPLSFIAPSLKKKNKKKKKPGTSANSERWQRIGKGHGVASAFGRVSSARAQDIA